MSKIINFAKVIRRNWKKSTVFFGILAYGASYGVGRYQTFQMMRAYCEEAKEFGEKTLPFLTKPKHVTVILNPEANNKKSNIQFEKFAAPLLHLAGFKVSIFQTEKEKQAQELMEIMANTDAVIVAGGNGTLHEVVTGLMRRPDKGEEKLPLGIIPVGKTNTVAKYLFGSKSSSDSQLMAEATMAIIRETTATLDVMKIQYANEDKPVYALCTFEQGVFSDLEQIVPKYWYLGALKDKFVYFLHSFKKHDTIKNTDLQYVAPCAGCSRCYIPTLKGKSEVGRWWNAFVPKKSEVKASNLSPDYSNVINEECGKVLSLEPSYSNISVSTVAADQKQNHSRGLMWIKIYPEFLSFKQFLLSGVNYRVSKLKDSVGTADIIKARELRIELAEQEVNEKKDCDWYYIDNEKYKRSSCNISLIPKEVTVFG